MMYKLIAGGALFLALMSAGIYIKHVIAENARLTIQVKQADQYKKKVEERDAKAIAQQNLDEAADKKTAEKIDSLEKETVVLRKAWDKVKNTVEVPSENTGCTEQRLSAAFWVCSRAAISGNTGDIAACQASAGNDTFHPSD